MLADNQWLECAKSFDLGICIHYGRNVTIESRQQVDNTILWVLKMDSWVLNKNGKFVYEPNPSSRTDSFIDETRWKCKNELHSFWKRSITKKEPLYVD